jgi:hypothetical protein
MAAALTGAQLPSCKTADDRVESLIAAKAAKLGGQEYCQYRIYAVDDVDGDQKDDFLVVFSVEGEGGGGNGVVQYLAVFASRNEWQPVAVETGRRGGHLVTKMSVGTDGVIEFATSEYKAKDPMCCPSGKGTLRFRLKGRELVAQ